MTVALIVEGDEVEAERIRACLWLVGVEGKRARTAEEACGMLEEGGYGLVVASLELPGANGLQLCKRVRKSSNVPLVIVGRAGWARLAACALGCDAFVTRPFEPLELCLIIKTVLRRA